MCRNHPWTGLLEFAANLRLEVFDFELGSTDLPIRAGQNRVPCGLVLHILGDHLVQLALLSATKRTVLAPHITACQP